MRGRGIGEEGSMLLLYTGGPGTEEGGRESRWRGPHTAIRSPALGPVTLPGRFPFPSWLPTPTLFPFPLFRVFLSSLTSKRGKGCFTSDASVLAWFLNRKKFDGG